MIKLDFPVEVHKGDGLVKILNKDLDISTLQGILSQTSSGWLKMSPMWVKKIMQKKKINKQIKYVK